LEILNEIVRSIAFIVLLAAFVEMLLPGEQIGRYVRLIMGLFIVVTLLTPIMDSLDNGLAYGVTAWNMPSDRGVTSIIQKGGELKQKQEAIVLKEYVSRLERQIQAVAQLVSGVDRAEVSVELERSDSLYMGDIKKVLITVWVKNPQEERLAEKKEPGKPEDFKIPEKETVAPVLVDLGAKTGQKVEHDQSLTENILQNVKTTVSKFYDLPVSKIVVTSAT